MQILEFNWPLAVLDLTGLQCVEDEDSFDKDDNAARCGDASAMWRCGGVSRTTIWWDVRL